MSVVLSTIIHSPEYMSKRTLYSYSDCLPAGNYAFAIDGPGMINYAGALVAFGDEYQPGESNKLGTPCDPMQAVSNNVGATVETNLFIYGLLLIQYQDIQCQKFGISTFFFVSCSRSYLIKHVEQTQYGNRSNKGSKKKRKRNKRVYLLNLSL